MAKKKISNAQHRKNAQKLYEKDGQSAVFDYAEKNKIPYEVCGENACNSESPAINHICLCCGQSTKAKFTVPVCRTSYGFRNVEVLAKSLKEAEKLALEDAGNHEFSEKDADYTIAG